MMIKQQEKYDVKNFLKSQWQHNTKSINYVTYRWLVAIIFIIILSLSLAENNVKRAWNTWPIYLTHWGLVLYLLANFLAAILVTLHNYNAQFQNNIVASDRVPVVIQIYWVLQSIAVTLALLITIVYWSLVHKYGTTITGTTTSNHIVNSVILIIDMFVIRHPFRIFHMIYVEVLLVIFLIFSFIYYEAGGLNSNGDAWIYPILNWANATRTILLSFATLALTAVIHIFLYGTYILRVMIYEMKEKYQNSSKLPV